MTKPHAAQRPWGRNKPKPTGTKFVRQTVYLDQRHVGLIHEWNPQNSLSFSERLRQILDFVQSETR